MSHGATTEARAPLLAADGLIECQRIPAAIPDEGAEATDALGTNPPVPAKRPIAGVSAPEIISRSAAWSLLRWRRRHQRRSWSAALTGGAANRRGGPRPEG